ncbi:hypothetical protein FLAV_00023 [Flavobacteriales bacterium]|nr:hypothetical protein FLAV_00023 [Flavobacteriales bacterium]
MKKKNSILIFAFFISLNCIFGNTMVKTIGFVENKGQILNQFETPNQEVKYLLHGNGMNVQLKKNSFSYDTYKIERKSAESAILNELEDSEKLYYKEAANNNSYLFNRIDIAFLGANPNPEIVSAQVLEAYYNFYTYNTKEEGVTHVRSYSKITYKNIYDGIDIEFVSHPSKNKFFEYNFIIHPGADLSQISIRYNGVDFSEIKNNSVRLYVHNGTIEEQIPFTYISESKRPCVALYEEKGINTYGIKVKGVVKGKTLVIDPMPVLSWGTYFGHTEYDEILNVHADNYENVYSVGRTKSLMNIATNNAFSSVYNGGSSDALLAKFNLSGQLLWCTYYGGSEFDYGWDVTTVDTNVFILGETRSATNISTMGTHQPAFAGGNSDAFVCRFTQSGLRIWATYYGGGFTEYTRGIANNGNALFITGRTSSLNNISTPGAHKTTYSDLSDMFLASLSLNGGLNWATYFGGNEMDLGRDILVDNAGRIVVIGSTKSATGIATVGSYKTYLSGIMDAFIAKFTSSGNLIWATYYGGNDTDDAVSISSDSQQNIYIVGNTASLNGISTSTAHQFFYAGGGTDAFLAKFSKNGNLMFGTYYGGSNNDRGYGVTTNLNDDVIIVGSTISTNNISTSGALQQNLAGGYDAYVAMFNKFGQRLWGSYYGGVNDDIPHSVSVVPIAAFCDFFVGGWTFSSSGISTPFSHQPVFSGGTLSDAFLTHFKTCVPNNIIPQNLMPSQVNNNLKRDLQNEEESDEKNKIEIIEYASFVEIHAHSTIRMVQIVDLAGKVLSELSLLQDKAIVSTQYISTGVYLLKVYTEAETPLVKKIFLNSLQN